MRREKGSVLLVSLVVLLLMTFLGLYGVKSSVVEERISGNFKNKELAFQVTESVLRDAESWLISRTAEIDPSGTGAAGIWSFNSPDGAANATEWWRERDASWWSLNGVLRGGVVSGTDTRGSAIVEYVNFRADTLLIGNGESGAGSVLYRITAKHGSSNGKSKKMIQSFVSRRY